MPDIKFIIYDGGYMLFMQMLIMSKLLLLAIIILCCLRELMRGKVFAIQYLYIEILFLLFFILILFQEYVSYYKNDSSPITIYSLGLMEWLLILLAVSLCITAILIIIRIPDLRNQYLLWGVKEEVLLDVMEKFLKEDHMDYGKDDNKLILGKYPEDIYQHSPFVIQSAGSILSAKHTKKRKADQYKLLPKTRETLRKYSLSISSRIVLFGFILFCCFVMITTLQQLH